MLPFDLANEACRYEARLRAAERRWRFLAEEGLLGPAEPAARPSRPRPHPLRRLARRLPRLRSATTT